MTRNKEFCFRWVTALRHRVALLLLFSVVLLAAPGKAVTPLIVQVLGGRQALQAICNLLGCTVQHSLGDPLGQVFLISAPLTLPISALAAVPGVLSVELDQVGKAMDAVSQGAAPAALYNSTPVSYYGTTVRQGYVLQPAAQIVGIASAQSTYRVSGSGIVAVIDTGVDTTHPVLTNVLLPGYDFTRNQPGADEKGDLNQSTTAVIDQWGSGVVDQSTTAVVDQSTTAVIDRNSATALNQPQYADFGHGTMVAGVIHLVAPTAQILPLKAFNADGTGHLSDVVQAIYYAVLHQARVLNMSFDFQSSSTQLKAALSYARLNGVIGAAAAGNSGQQTLVYPAAYQSSVMGVASTSNSDTLSTFSNYGSELVWVGAPGEGIVTLYPFGTYAATWGTSFSTPFVSGAAALLLNLSSVCAEGQIAESVANAQPVNSMLGNGRLDLNRALQSWQQERPARTFRR
jgi:subtilisin family serine protease